MTVAELIERLSTMPQSANVTLTCSYDCGFGMAGGDITDVYYTQGRQEVYIQSDDS